jgi:hypothetical protein
MDAAAGALPERIEETRVECGWHTSSGACSPFHEATVETRSRFFRAPKGYTVEEAFERHASFFRSRIRYLVTHHRIEPREELLTPLARPIFLGVDVSAALYGGALTKLHIYFDEQISSSRLGRECYSDAQRDTPPGFRQFQV